MEASFQTEKDEKRLDSKIHRVNVNVLGRLLLVKAMTGPEYQIIQCTSSIFRLDSIEIQENPQLRDVFSTGGLIGHHISH